MIKIKTLPVGIYEANCYLVWLEEKKVLYIIDPGSDESDIISKAKKFPFEKVAILLTHAHVDHISAVNGVSKELNAEYIYLNKNDEKLYYSEHNAIPPYYPVLKDLVATTENISSDDFKIIELPGHSQGGSGFYFQEAKALFAGDTIFANSIGRTDFPGGNYNTLENSIKNNIYTLPIDTIIYAGHGPTTTVGKEKTSNSYVRG